MSFLLQSYDAERADFQRLLDAVEQLDKAPESDLQSFDWLTRLIREVGLVPIPEAETAYAGEEEYINASQQGVIQLPREFARYLLALSNHRPARYLEVGCFNGATAVFATAYLRRFNADFEAVTIDLWPSFLFYEDIRNRLPLRYFVGKTSFDFAGQTFDAVFIDGDHSFDWAWADYQNVGRAARICAVHDIRNAPYRELPLGGVCAVWELICREAPNACMEICEHPTGEVMGIGLRWAR